MLTYIFFYNGKQTEIKADSMYEAKLKAIEYFKTPKSKQHMVHGMLAEKDGKQITHTPDF